VAVDKFNAGGLGSFSALFDTTGVANEKLGVAVVEELLSPRFNEKEEKGADVVDPKTDALEETAVVLFVVAVEFPNPPKTDVDFASSVLLAVPKLNELLDDEDTADDETGAAKENAFLTVSGATVEDPNVIAVETVVVAGFGSFLPGSVKVNVVDSFVVSGAAAVSFFFGSSFFGASLIGCVTFVLVARGIEKLDDMLMFALEIVETGLASATDFCTIGFCC
jgi:hypothetical protein